VPAFIAAMIIGGCAPATPVPGVTEQPSQATGSASPSSSAAWTTYTSERNGFSLDLPGEWRYRPATEDWPAGEYPSGGSAYIDNFEQPPASFPTVDIVTQPLADDMTPEEFLAWLDVENARICTVESTESVMVDGVEGRLQRQTCGYNAWEVAVFNGGQVYLIYWLGEPSRVEAERPILDQVIASFRFP
jgi:hypothetical protein